MTKLTYRMVIEAGRKAFLEERLQAQQSIQWAGCHYAIGGKYSDGNAVSDDHRQWGNDKPVVTCVVGAALTDDEQIQEFTWLGGIYKSQAWSEFIEEEDIDNIANLQSQHDAWARGETSGKEFHDLLFAD